MLTFNPMTNVEWSINQTRMSYDCGRKPDKTHAGTGRVCKLTQKDPSWPKGSQLAKRVPAAQICTFFFAVPIASQLFMVHLSLLAKCYTVASNTFSSPKRKTITTPISTKFARRKPLVVYFKQLSEIFTELLCKHLSSSALPYSSSSTIFLNQIYHTVNLT